jgi:hypothetical protein
MILTSIGIINSGVSISPAPTIVTQGLALNLDSSDITSYPGSGSTWFDISSNTNDATSVQTPTFISSPYKSFEFDGGAITATGQVDSFSVPDNNSLDRGFSALTIEMWININEIQGALSNSPNMLFSKRTTNTNGYVGFFNTNSFIFRIGTSSPSQLTWSTTPVVNKWQQIVITIDTSIAVIYNNAESQFVNFSPPVNFVNINTAASLLIGDINPNNIDIFGFKGNIGAFRLYNIALTNSQVLQNYNAVKSNYGL